MIQQNTDGLSGSLASTILEDVLDGLEVDARAAFVMYDIERLPLTEVADTLGASPAAVRRHLAQAHEVMTDCLLGAGFEASEATVATLLQHARHAPEVSPEEVDELLAKIAAHLPRAPAAPAPAPAPASTAAPPSTTGPRWFARSLRVACLAAGLAAGVGGRAAIRSPLASPRAVAPAAVVRVAVPVAAPAPPSSGSGEATATATAPPVRAPRACHGAVEGSDPVAGEINRRLNAIDRARGDGDYEQVGAMCRALLARYPRHPLVTVAAMWLGQGERRLGHHAAAIEAFVRVRRLAPGSRLAGQAWQAQIDALRDAGRSEEAEAEARLLRAHKTTRGRLPGRSR